MLRYDNSSSGEKALTRIKGMRGDIVETKIDVDGKQVE
jgi:hypothetical protein